MAAWLFTLFLRDFWSVLDVLKFAVCRICLVREPDLGELKLIPQLIQVRLGPRSGDLDREDCPRAAFLSPRLAHPDEVMRSFAPLLMLKVGASRGGAGAQANYLGKMRVLARDSSLVRRPISFFILTKEDGALAVAPGFSWAGPSLAQLKVAPALR